MRLPPALTLLAAAVCTALTAGILMAGPALAAVHPDKQQTMISLTLPTSEVTFGQESVADLIVSVPPAAGGLNPTGTVAVESPETGSAVCQAQIPSGATTVVCHLSDVFLPPGEYHLFAVYTGDGNYLPADSSATPQSLTVAKEPTATTLALPAATLAFDQQGGALLTFQVTAATSGTPTGPVTVTAGSTPICSGVLTNGTGTCALATGELSPGNYQLTATYGGDGDFAGSASDPQALTITTAPTVTTLTLSTAKVTFGHEQAERLSIQVTATAGSTPTGQVAVSAGSTTLCVITLDGGNGSCTLAATKLRPGTHHLTATYSGDVTHAGSTSGSKALAVASEPTATALTLSATKVKLGHEQAEHLTVTVKPGFSGTPAGKVTINAGGTRICVITLAKGQGSCTLTASKLRPGTYTLTATYPGTTPYAASTSPKKTLTVTK
jgi:Bacterial Ig-like domain (group 3)